MNLIIKLKSMSRKLKGIKPNKKKGSERSQLKNKENGNI